MTIKEIKQLIDQLIKEDVNGNKDLISFYQKKVQQESQKELKNMECLKWRMYHNGATSFSDEEIERTLKDTCAPTLNIKRAKYYRDLGVLIYSEEEQDGYIY